jgi:5-methyltetrahydrofolate--homocysteine methyltransferase
MDLIEYNEGLRFRGGGGELVRLLRERIVILDGAMGTMIQQHKFGETDFRGERFKALPKDQKGNNDLLVLTQPEAIRRIHHAYLAAGCDIVETNTFNANRVSMLDFGAEHLVREINMAAVRVARAACDDIKSSQPGRVAFVAGSIGPTNRTASLGPDVNHPGRRNITFDELREAYFEQTLALVEAGADLLLPICFCRRRHSIL